MKAANDSRRKVLVYRNLHRNCWSVKAGKEPVKHVETLTLVGVSFRVRPAGNRRVRVENKKNVHAFVCGEVADAPPPSWPPRKVTYNPYTNETFVDESGASVGTANWCFFTKKGEVYATCD